MLYRPSRHHRRGTVLVESAIIYSVMLFLLFAIIVGGLGMFRYQAVAHLAREGARYASVHGGKYQQDGWPQRGQAPAISTSQDLRDYLLPLATLLDSNYLEVSVSWTAPASITPANYPSYLDPDPTLVPPGQKVVTNNVRVRVTVLGTPG